MEFGHTEAEMADVGVPHMVLVLEPVQKEAFYIHDQLVGDLVGPVELVDLEGLAVIVVLKMKVRIMLRKPQRARIARHIPQELEVDDPDAILSSIFTEQMK